MLGSRLGQALGPWGLLAVGVAVGVMASPVLRKGSRRLAIMATCGVLSIVDQAKKTAGDVKNVANGAKGELGKLVEEAKTASIEKTTLVQE